MRFVNPLFLIGLAGVMLPVLIHLLTRDRIRKVEFSTLRFFAKNSQRVLRRKRFQEAILLAMRMAVCGLLAVAFARPFFPDKTAAGAGLSVRTARVIVADVSRSMGRGAATAEGLKKACEQALGELSEGTDAVGLVTFADAPDVTAPVSRQFDEVRARAAAIAPGQGGTNIPAALKAADELLREVKATSKEIVLVSDLQRTGWVGSGKWEVGGGKLGADVKLRVQSVAPAGGVLAHGDVAIVDRFCPESLVMDEAPQAVAVKVANLSGRQLDDVPVTLTVNGQKAAEQTVNLKAGATMAVQFAHVFGTPGDTQVVVHVGAAEAAATPEDTAYFNARVMGRIPVVILNGSPSANPDTDGAFYWSVALSPKQMPPFAVRTVVAGRARPEDVRDAMVVIVSNAGKLPAGMNEALRELLERGGGVLFVPGDVKADEFNASFAGTEAASDLAPCRLRREMASDPVPGEVGGVSLVKIDFEHPVFRQFARPHAGDFSLTRFFRWWEVGDYQGALGSGQKAEGRGQKSEVRGETRVVARFEDGRPALLERGVGRGIVMLLASSADGRWTNFAPRAVFPGFVHEVGKYLSIRVEKKTAYAVGQVLPVEAGLEAKDPDGKALVKTGAAGVRAERVGFYPVVDRDGKQAFCYAVNTEPAEADTATVTADEIAAAIQRSPEEVAGMLAAKAGKGPEPDPKRLWWYVALAVGALFAAELFVANRTLRH